MVDRAEGLEPAGRSGGDQHVRIGILGGLEEGAQERGGEFGHVACYHQVTVGRLVLEDGQDGAQGPLAGVDIGEHAVGEGAGAMDAADEAHGACRLADGFGHGLRQDPAAKGQEGLVAAHAGAASSYQYEARPIHTKMITLGITIRNYPDSGLIRVADSTPAAAETSDCGCAQSTLLIR